MTEMCRNLPKNGAIYISLDLFLIHIIIVNLVFLAFTSFVPNLGVEFFSLIIVILDNKT